MLRTRQTIPMMVIYNDVETGPDRYGNPLYGGGSQEYDVWVEQKAADELSPDRETRVSEWLFIFPPEAVVSAIDEVSSDHELFDGDSLEIIGDPVKVYNSRGLHHIEVTARRVNG